MNEYKKGKKNKHKKKRNVKFKKKIFISLIFISIVGILIGSMCGYTVVSDLKYDIHYLKQDLRKEQVRLEELKAKVDTDKSIQEIEKKAKEELGMDYPTKSQTRYIEVEK